MSAIKELQNILVPNTIIQTKHKTGYDWVYTSVINAFGSFIEVKLVKDYLTSVLMIGDRLVCKYMSGNHVYILQASVYNVKVESRSIVLKASSLKTINNTRSSRRYDVYLCSSYNLPQSIGEIYCVVTNLSFAGIGIMTKGELKQGDIIHISIYLSESDIVYLNCQVKWHDPCSDANCYGVGITEIDELNEYKYAQYIKKLERREKNLIKKGVL